MKFFLFTFLALGLCHALLAQNLSPGFVVTSKGDTIRGFIVDGTDAELSPGITFKKLDGDKGEVKYLPKDLVSFGFNNGRIFRSFSFATQNDSVYIFAKRDVEGKVSMFTYARPEENRPEILLTNNSSGRTFHLTPPKKLKIDQNGKSRAGQSFEYLGLLNLAKGVQTNYTSSNVSYHEKSIRKDILAYNQQYANDFPVYRYRPQPAFFYDITAGFSLYNGVGTDFRMAFYGGRTFPELSRKMALIRGVSYRYSSLSEPRRYIRNNSDNFRQQFLSAIPVGLYMQTDTSPVRFYAYGGIGLGLAIETNYHVVNYQDMGNEQEMGFFPALNLGAGVKIKAGSTFIIAELTPPGNRKGLFLNLGLSF
ncbi:hypothetical protein KK083_09230 [Fulvivirgaceae bacterium PWU4]|uniref:Outer membrane protein beta-barrel domain-containing protein n=1 Tax=Chryseosolibacter histidini TaxID=2782349 RepID=A0AAP2DIQ6_9BACT|nr:hypothetical protein [Chryseosolibacter histidini]MBT1697055.1 hypothetical protein [Chryseosolibacter histidini]